MTERRSTFHYPDDVVDVGSDEERWLVSLWQWRRMLPRLF